MREFARRVALLVYRLLPKFDHAVLWGWPDNEDSVLALETALQHTPVRRVIVLMSDTAVRPPRPDGPKTRRVRKDTAAGLAWFLLARHVFFTHRCFMREFPDSVVAVNIWHGMPVKRIGWMSEGDQGIASTHAVATSPEWAAVVDEALRPRRGILTVGLPRNDRLFVDGAEVRRSLDLEVDRRLVLWLPTYRRSVRGRITVDGVPSAPPFEMPVDVDAVARSLDELGITLLVKPHPMSERVPVTTASSVWVIDDDWIATQGLSLYALVGACDALVSDVSSVVVDYLLLDRPVVHAMADIDEYRSSRGFSIEPVEDLFAGPVVSDGAGLVEALRVALTGGDPDAERRRRLRERFHTFHDDGATDRLLAAVGLGGTDSDTRTTTGEDTP